MKRWPPGHSRSNRLEGTATSVNLRALVAARRSEFAEYDASAAPPDRFETHGMVHQGRQWEQAPRPAAPLLNGGEQRSGTGCYPGVVRATVRVVRDPREAELRPGEILVAERTDPGWVMLFPAAAGLTSYPVSSVGTAATPFARSTLRFADLDLVKSQAGGTGIHNGPLQAIVALAGAAQRSPGRRSAQ